MKDWRGTHYLEGWSAILVSGSDLVKLWRRTYHLEEWSAILFSGSELVKLWRGTHMLGDNQPFSSVILNWWNRGTYHLERWSAILVSDSELVKLWRGTHMLVVRVTLNLVFITNSPVSKFHVHLLQSYWFALEKHITGLNHLSNTTYILSAFHKPNFCRHSTRYCAHVLNQMSISEGTG